MPRSAGLELLTPHQVVVDANRQFSEHGGQSANQRRALLQSNPPRHSQPQTHQSMAGETAHRRPRFCDSIASKAAQLEDFRFHDLRHTAASWMRMQGADIHTVAQLLGHKDLRMAARYQHLSPVFLSDAVKKLDQVFGATPQVAENRSEVRALSSP